jgi:hypothetical protein
MKILIISQEELKKQMQQSLVESDTHRDLCRTIHSLESQLKQMKSANYSYKAQVLLTGICVGQSTLWRASSSR